MQKIKIIILSLLFTSSAYGQNAIELPELKVLFEKYNTEGSILIFDESENQYYGYNLDRCKEGFIPVSTFKIPNSLIALETGIVDTDTVFHWLGEKRDSKNWECDMNLATAFSLSCVPIYKQLARSIGVVRMKEYLSKLNYGRMDVSQNNIDNFWLEGNSQISQFEQIEFLNRLYNNQLPLSKKTQETVKQFMIREQTATFTLSGKTGWSGSIGQIGWFVGYVKCGDKVHYFATNVVPKDGKGTTEFLQSRIDITKEILALLNILPAS